MSTSWGKPGFNAVGEYQRSGIPFVTSSHGSEATSTAVVQISFPRVTRWFQISTSGSSDSNAHLRIGFTENGVKGMGTVTGSIRTGEMFRVDDNPNNPQQPKYVNVSPAPTTREQANAAAGAASTSRGAKNYFTIAASSGTDTIGDTSHRFELACTDLFLMAENGSTGFTIIAGMTNIPRDAMQLTGSNGFFGVG